MSRRLHALTIAGIALLAGCLGASPTAEDPVDDGAGADATAFTLTPAQALPNVAGAFAAEPHVAVRALDSGAHAVVVGAVEYLEGTGPTQDVRFTMAVHRSLDNGTTWTQALLPLEVLAPFDPVGNMNYVGDPVLAYGPSGELYLGGVAAHGVWKNGPGGFPILLQLNDLTVFVTRSEDDGKTWSPALFWKRGAGTFGFPVFFAGVLEDKEWVSVGPDGVVHFTWTEFVETSSTLRYTRSTDGGRTWSEPLLLAMSRPGLESGPGPTRNQMAVQATTIAAPGGNRVYVSATEYPFSDDGAQGPTEGGHQLVWTSMDNGVSFGAPVIAGPATYLRFGTVFADPAAPHRVLVTAPEDKEESRAYVTESRDGGTTWSDPLWLGPDRTGTQQHPTGWIDAQGRARVIYYDAGWPDGERATFAIVENHTVTFEATPEATPVDPGPYRREYIGIAGSGSHAWGVWVGGQADNETHVEIARLHG